MNEARQLKFSEIQEGFESAFEVALLETDIDRFAEISGDFSPLHMDRAFAVSRGYAGRVVHGALLGAQVSRLVGMLMPGQDAVLQLLELTFHLPTYAGYGLEVRGKVLRKLDGLNAMQLGIEIRRTDQPTGKKLVSGKALVGFTKAASSETGK